MKKEDELIINPNNVPKHVAIIMDGNGRWAKERGVSRKQGHKAGSETLEKISDAAMEIGIKYLTVYAFSTENWKRSKEEVDGIMDLLRHYLKEHIKTAKKREVKVTIIGDRTALANDIQEQIKTLENLTKNKEKMNLVIALNYGGRDEIIRGINKIIEDVKANKIDKLEEKDFNLFLDTVNIPDPELLIRTSGEERISNFLLWQIAYSEFNFSQKFWPDYNEKDLKKAVWEYQNRDRRFGGRNS